MTASAFSCRGAVSSQSLESFLERERLGSSLDLDLGHRGRLDVR